MIIAVAMVRDEVDVLPLTIGNLWEQGVDRIFVADNMSVDGSGDLCADFGCTVTTDSEVGYLQAEKMTRLAFAAYEAGATWVLPFDADELWLGLSKLRGCPLDVVETVPHVFVGEKDRGPETFPKVCFRAHPDARLEMGNHNVQRPGPRGDAGLSINHYQYRSREQARRKVLQGRAAYDATNLPSYYGSHWRDLAALTEDEFDAWWSEYSGEPCPSHVGPSPAGP